MRRTAAASTLDPTEKGAVSYFLGLAICKLFAARLLGTPWLLHLDVYRPALNAVLSGRSRPDLIGQMTSGEWIAFECKGRVSPPDQGAKDKAKAQALRVLTIGGQAPALRIGGVAYFEKEILRFFWKDPEPGVGGIKNPIDVKVAPRDWQYYYAPVIDLVRSFATSFEQALAEPTLVPIQGADISVGVHPEVLRWFGSDSVNDVLPRIFLKDRANDEGPFRSDGIALVAGESWRQPFDESLG